MNKAEWYTGEESCFHFNELRCLNLPELHQKSLSVSLIVIFYGTTNATILVYYRDSDTLRF